eukprot:COSAG02_NODE_434_length_22429_cov_15.013704_5_plen_96_part_00
MQHPRRSLSRKTKSKGTIIGKVSLDCTPWSRRPCVPLPAESAAGAVAASAVRQVELGSKLHTVDWGGWVVALILRVERAPCSGCDAVSVRVGGVG